MSFSPASSDNSVPEYWIKQSEMLQGVINRMASNSLEIKKFGVTVWTAIVGFGVTNKNHWFFGLALASIVVFGVLDLYYLFLERKFRDNFNRLVKIINDRCSPEENCVSEKEDRSSAEKDREWIKKVAGNFMKLDRSVSFLEALNPCKASSNPACSWANLPYLIMFMVTVALFFVKFSSSTPSP